MIDGAVGGPARLVFDEEKEEKLFCPLTGELWIYKNGKRVEVIPSALVHSNVGLLQKIDEVPDAENSDVPSILVIPPSGEEGARSNDNNEANSEVSSEVSDSDSESILSELTELSDLATDPAIVDETEDCNGADARDTPGYIPVSDEPGASDSTTGVESGEATLYSPILTLTELSEVEREQDIDERADHEAPTAYASSSGPLTSSARPSSDVLLSDQHEGSAGLISANAGEVNAEENDTEKKSVKGESGVGKKEDDAGESEKENVPAMLATGGGEGFTSEAAFTSKHRIPGTALETSSAYNCAE